MPGEGSGLVRPMASGPGLGSERAEGWAPLACAAATAAIAPGCRPPSPQTALLVPMIARLLGDPGLTGLDDLELATDATRCCIFRKRGRCAFG